LLIQSSPLQYLHTQVLPPSLYLTNSVALLWIEVLENFAASFFRHFCLKYTDSRYLYKCWYVPVTLCGIPDDSNLNLFMCFYKGLDWHHMHDLHVSVGHQTVPCIFIIYNSTNDCTILIFLITYNYIRFAPTCLDINMSSSEILLCLAKIT